MPRRYSGQIIDGNINSKANELEIRSIKNIPTQSVWVRNQISKMLDETSKAIDLNEKMVITLRDTIPLILEQEEILKLNGDIHEIQSMMNIHDE
ncbi:hypothetical protein [Ammoniphilus sp. CFH 90114]|uniref:hypothetical protein n=1 Tax=Ammoniphilus sp. CFH 90114 TaxID=2493665 RepID=UPI00100F5CB4|nr:hypothetical protein [Ammoniphilus sp. CFH 90114]RXT05267.1 hypothetical protein EIZ39_17975 [Ammoniphilus sp. CFH 90114]